MLRTIYVLGLFLIGILITNAMIPQSSEKGKISLRPFPYPYRAAVSLCNNIRGTDSREEFLSIQKYLCTKQSTPWGKGLGLEVGNSFWFYDFSGKSKFTIFDTTGKINPEAAVISDFIKAGYIDVLNTYGDFPPGKFQQIWANQALKFLQEQDLTLPIWVNLTQDPTCFNIGRGKSQLGDDPDSPLYHSYLFPRIGIIYVNLNDFTYIIGQDTTINIWKWFVRFYEFSLSAWKSFRAQKWDLNLNNRLLNPCYLDDQHCYFRFHRFLNAEGDYPNEGVDVNYLSKQLNKRILARLLRCGGYMIVYTRFGSNQSDSEWIPRNSRKALGLLANFFQQGQIFVTTSSRLLIYDTVHRFLDWNCRKVGEDLIINITGLQLPPDIIFKLKSEHLQGLTFYTSYPQKTRIYFQGELVTPLQINPPDETGNSTVTIPWRWLNFPQGY